MSCGIQGGLVIKDPASYLITPIHVGMPYSIHWSRTGSTFHEPGLYSSGPQFLYYWNDISNHGLFISPDDRTGLGKYVDLSGDGTNFVYSLNYIPNERRNVDGSITGAVFSTPYDLVVTPINGDDWDACNKYYKLMHTYSHPGMAQGKLKDIIDTPSLYPPSFVSTRLFYAGENLMETGSFTESQRVTVQDRHRENTIRLSSFYGSNNLAAYVGGWERYGYKSTGTSQSAFPMQTGYVQAINNIIDSGIPAVTYIIPSIIETGSPLLTGSPYAITGYTLRNHDQTERQGDEFGTYTVGTGLQVSINFGHPEARKTVRTHYAQMTGVIPGLKGTNLDIFGATFDDYNSNIPLGLRGAGSNFNTSGNTEFIREYRNDYTGRFSVLMGFPNEYMMGLGHWWQETSFDVTLPFSYMPYTQWIWNEYTKFIAWDANEPNPYSALADIYNWNASWKFHAGKAYVFFNIVDRDEYTIAKSGESDYETRWLLYDQNFHTFIKTMYVDPHNLTKQYFRGRPCRPLPGSQYEDLRRNTYAAALPPNQPVHSSVWYTDETTTPSMLVVLSNWSTSGQTFDVNMSSVAYPMLSGSHNVYEMNSNGSTGSSMTIENNLNVADSLSGLSVKFYKIDNVKNIP